MVCPKGSKWIHDMVYSRSMLFENLAEEALSKDLKDITMIWTEGSNRRHVYHKYFRINRTRDPRWSDLFSMWPRGDMSIIFPDTIYNYAGYKKLWWDILKTMGKCSGWAQFPLSKNKKKYSVEIV